MRPGKRRQQKNPPWGVFIVQAEKIKASMRAKMAHPVRVIRRQFGHTKVRYRGLVKNTAQLIALFALFNVWMDGKVLMHAAQA